MNPTRPKSPRAELELQARYVMLTALAEDKRILDLAADPRGLVLLAEAGAAELTGAAVEPEALRSQLAGVGVEGADVVAQPRRPADLGGFGDATFDLVIFPDLAAALHEDEAWLTELRRILAPEGYLVLALPNPNGRRLSDLAGESFAATLTYEEAFARLSPSFGALTVLVQSPLVANLFYDLESAEEDPGLVFDRSLLDEEIDEAGWYLLIFGPQPVHRDDLAIVQVPFAPVLQAVRGRPDEQLLALAAVDADEQAHARLRQEKEELAQRVLTLQAELVRQQYAAHALEEKLAAAAAVTSPPSVETEAPADLGVQAEAAEEMVFLRQRVDALKAERQLLLDKLDRLREQLAASSQTHDEAVGQLALWRPRLTALKAERDELAAKTQALRQRLLTLEQDAAGVQSSRQQLEEQLAAARAEEQQTRHQLEEKLAATRAEEQQTRQQLGEQLAAARAEEQQTRQQLEEQLAATRAEREAAVGDTQGFRQQLESIAAEREQVAEQLERVRQAAEADNEDRAALTAELHLLRARLAELRTDREREHAKLSELRAKSLAEAKRTVGDETHVTRLRERIKGLKLERRVTQERLAQLRAKQVHLVGEHEAAVSAMRLAEQRVSELRAERDQLQGVLNESRQRQMADEAEREENSRRLAIAEGRITALKEERCQLTSKLQALRQANLERTDDSPAMHAALAGMQAERDQLTVRLAGAEDEHGKSVRRLQEQLDALSSVHEQAATATARLAELEGELARQTHDRASFESQIKDLLEETAELREAAEGDATSEARAAEVGAEGDRQAEALRQEKIRNESLREDLARLQGKLGSVEGENQSLAAEVQRLTDAVHDAQHPPAPKPVSPHDAETVVMASPLLTSSRDSAKDKPAPTPRDAIGRPLESLEDIEDLIAGSVPPAPNRR